MNLKTSILIACLTMTTQCFASPDELIISGISSHYNKQEGQKFNEVNSGLGLLWKDKRVDVVGNVDVSVGFYHNSEYKTSVYVAIHKLPYQILGGRVGITLGVATGYAISPIVIIPAPTICWKYTCVLVAPSIKDYAGSVSVQFNMAI